MGLKKTALKQLKKIYSAKNDLSSKITRNIAKKLDLKYKSENTGKFMSQNTNLDRLFLVSMKICCTKSRFYKYNAHSTLYIVLKYTFRFNNKKAKFIRKFEI